MRQQSPILYSFRRCPYAMRARMALSYAGVEYQNREILLKNKPASMLEYSAKGTVPVLIHNDIVIDESLDVMFWALEQKDTDKWLEDKDQFELIKLCDHQFKKQLDQYKYSARYELSEQEYRDQSLWFLHRLNEQLSNHSNLFSEKVSMADIAIFPFIRQFSFVNKKWFDESDYIHVIKWLDRHINADLFTNVMVKHPLWQDNFAFIDTKMPNI